MKKYLYTLTFLLITSSIFGQDHHFTQYFASPQILNPANTGFLPGKYRAALLFRDQWRTVLEKAYTSNTANFDIKLNSPFGVASKDKMGIGLAFMNDHIGFIDLNNNTLVMGLSYHKYLSKKGNQYLRAGFQLSFNQSNINYENLYFSDEFDGVSEYSLGTFENLPANIFAYSNFNLGLLYTADLSDRSSIIIGGAMHNLFEPNASFYKTDPNITNLAVVYRRYSGSLALNFDLTDRLSLIPRALFTIQGPYTRLNTGTNLRLRVNNYSNNAIQIGSWVRMASASAGLEPASLVTIIGFEINGFNIGFSYDLDLHETSGVAFGSNAFEISFAYIGDYEDEFVFCPQF